MSETPNHNGNEFNVDALDRKVSKKPKNPEWADDLANPNYEVEEANEQVKDILSEIKDYGQAEGPDSSEMEGPKADVPDKQIRHNGNAADVSN